jgi:uncharacterized protein
VRSKPLPGFLVDGMLGTLATKLRILGFDTIYSRSNDQELLDEATTSKRILVTSDNELYLRCSRSRTPAILVRGINEKENLVMVLNKAGIHSIDARIRSRCSICNGRLYSKGKDNLGRTIYVCLDCGKLYWRGSHWKKLSPLFAEISKSVAKKE